MAIQSHLRSWQGHAVRHIPARAKYDIYDFSYAGKSAENRWNFQGEPTLYLAKEKNVALGEYARHFQIDRTIGLGRKTQERAVYRFEVKLADTIDLCDPSVWRELSLVNAPDCFKDREKARATANFLRYTTDATAIFVPSMAFLDDLEQWCLVLFLEKLATNVREFLPDAVTDGTFKIE
jgi:RES domain-containing protein